MTFSQLSLEYFFQKKADGKILSGSAFVFKHSQGFPLIRVVSTQTQTRTEIAAHPSFKFTTFFLASLYQKYYLKLALLFSALWMQKHNERKHKITLAEVNSQIQDMPGFSPDPSFSWWSPWRHDLTLLLLCQASHPTEQNHVFSGSHRPPQAEVSQEAEPLYSTRFIYLLVYWGKTNSLEDRFLEEFGADLILSLLMSAKPAETK